MVKLKNKSNRTSESVQKTYKKKLNPFEVHINKEKLKVLGRKLKNDRGLPGVSREKALNKRKHTLQQEYKLHHKVNKFLDKRIGEKDINMTNEDRFIARYAKLKAKNHKKSIFNLADEEVLTHKGQTLEEIEKFDDPRSDDEDNLDEEMSGKLDANFVEEAHFGGGILKKTNVDGAKTHKDLIDQLITESKKRKAEKQKMKEETLELTEKLDTEWKDLLPLITKTKSSNTVTTNERADEYDKVMRQLKFEARGTPSDRLKTEDEIAREEKETLERLENERLERMRGFTAKLNVSKTHISADDLGDNFAYDSDPEFTLSYNKEGTANITLEAEINGKIISSQENKFSDEDNSNSDSEQNDSSEDDETSSKESELEDNLSDLKEEILESESEDDNKNHNLKKATNLLSNQIGRPIDISKNHKIRDDLLKRKEIMEKARKELPYTYEFPKDYDNLQNLLQNENVERQYIIIERIIKCHHPSLNDKNKENLNILFTYLLQYINDLSTSLSDYETLKKCFSVYINLVSLVFELAETNVEEAHKAMVEVIKEKQLEYRKKNNCYPGIDTLLFLKLVSCLFSTSDFKHMVVTPSIVFIDQMLNNCKVRSRKDISFGLFLTTLSLEYTTFAKRFLPSAINFLVGILHMCIPKTGIKLIKIAPPFKSSLNTLVLFNNWSESNLNLKMDTIYLLNGEVEDEYKIKAFYLTLNLLEEFMINFKDLQSNYEIFNSVENYLNMIPINNYPKSVSRKAKVLQDRLIAMKTNRSLKYLVMTKRRPKALRLYEPNIEKIFDRKMHKVQSKEKAERDKLLHKIKREHKGALREIRRDKAFLARLKINQQIQSDNERKAKVRKLLTEASVQQSELNAIDRKSKRKM